MTTLTQENGGIDFFTLLSIRGRLRLECHGMTTRGGSTLQAFNRLYGQNMKRKQQALDWCNARVAEIKAAREKGL